MVIIGSVEIGHWVLWKGMHIYTRTHRRGSSPAACILTFPLGKRDLEGDTGFLYGSHRAAGHLVWLKLLVCVGCEVMKCKCSFSSPSGHKMWPYIGYMEPFNLQTSSVSYAYIKMAAFSPRGPGGFGLDLRMLPMQWRYLIDWRLPLDNKTSTVYIADHVHF